MSSRYSVGKPARRIAPADPRPPALADLVFGVMLDGRERTGREIGALLRIDRHAASMAASKLARHGELIGRTIAGSGRLVNHYRLAKMARED